MKLAQLSSFIALVEEGSFTRAAKRLGISQPSLSQRIRLLERDLGGPVIERLTGGVRPTAAGKALLPEAQAAVRAAERARAAARSALGLETGELEVATLLSMTIGLLPQAITAWHERFPDIGIRMIEYTHRNLLEEAVRTGVGDVAVGPTPVGWHGPVEPIGREELVVVLARSGAGPRQRTIDLGRLAGHRWVLFQPGHGLTDVVSAACRSAGFEPLPAVRTTQVEAAIRLAAAGVGPALVPDNCLPRSLDAAVLRVEPPVVRELAAYTRSGWTELTAAFLEALRDRRAPRD